MGHVMSKDKGCIFLHHGTTSDLKNSNCVFYIWYRSLNTMHQIWIITIMKPDLIRQADSS